MKLILGLSFLIGLTSLGHADENQIMPKTIDDLSVLIQNNNVNSVESFLDVLPTKLRSDYVLIYDSKSLQSAGFQTPRVMLKSNDARLLITFNASSKEKKGDSVEVIEFNDNDKNFIFSSIDFENKKPIIIKNNKMCQNCHGSDPRPYWSQYNRWPGFYGSDDDFLSKHVTDPTNIRQQEYKELLKFTQNNLTHPRYSKLIDLKNYRKIADLSTPGYSSNRYVINQKLTQDLFHLNGLRVSRIVSKLFPEKDDQLYILLNSLLHTTTRYPTTQQNPLYYAKFNSVNFIQAFDLETGLADLPGDNVYEFTGFATGINRTLGIADGLLSGNKSLRYLADQKIINKFTSCVNYEVGYNGKQLLQMSYPNSLSPECLDVQKMHPYTTMIDTFWSSSQLGSTDVYNHTGQVLESSPLYTSAKNKFINKYKLLDSNTAYKSKIDLIITLQKGYAVAKTSCMKCHSAEIKDIPSIPFGNIQQMKEFLKSKNSDQFINKVDAFTKPDKNGITEMPYLDKDSQISLIKYLKALSALN